MGLFRSTILQEEVSVEGHKITFYNSWSLLPYKSKATLSLDGVELARSSKMSHLNPNEPLFSVTDVSTSIKSIEVFIIGVFSIKACIHVNGREVHRGEIDRFDALQLRAFQE